jgi:hypothetical protein
MAHKYLVTPAREYLDAREEGKRIEAVPGAER